MRELLILSALLMATQAGAQGFGGSFDDAGGGTQAPVGQAPATGQGGFGGSFGTGAGGGWSTATAPAATPAPATGDGFGGSFVGGGAATPAPAETSTATGPQAPPPGGQDFGGASFDDDFVAEPSQIQPVVPGPTGGGGQTPAVQPPPPPPPVMIDPQIAAFEMRDFGVRPETQLRRDAFHAPTPTMLPGGSVLSTADLAGAMQQGIPMLLIDVLGGDYVLPNSYSEPGLATPGTFQDQIQQQVKQFLHQITGGDRTVPVVVYCSDPMCWLSYNGALRVAAAGWTNVYWYRGGVQAWQMAGLPMQPAGF